MEENGRCPFCESEEVEAVIITVNSNDGELKTFKCLVCGENFSKKIPSEENSRKNISQTTLKIF